MRITEFVINLFTRYAPVSETSIATLNVELSEMYSKSLHMLKTKEKRNEELDQKLETLATEMNATDVHTPEYQNKLFDFETISKLKPYPTLIEKGIKFLEKPLVKLLMLVAFAFVSRYIAKKLTEKKEEPEIEEQEENTQNYNPQYPYQQPPYYNPYGYGYPQPPYPNQSQPRR